MQELAPWGAQALLQQLPWRWSQEQEKTYEFIPGIGSKGKVTDKHLNSNQELNRKRSRDQTSEQVRPEPVSNYTDVGLSVAKCHFTQVWSLPWCPAPKWHSQAKGVRWLFPSLLACSRSWQTSLVLDNKDRHWGRARTLSCTPWLKGWVSHSPKFGYTKRVASMLWLSEKALRTGASTTPSFT